MLEDEHCIPILLTPKVACDGVVSQFSLWNQRDLFDLRFITESLQNRRLMDLNMYR